MITKISTCLLLSSLMGCLGTIKFIETDLWTLEHEVPIKQMSCITTPRIDGYYSMGNSSDFTTDFTLFEDGYFSGSSPRFTVDYDMWGRFLIEGDSITIQFFRDTNAGTSIPLFFWRKDYAVCEGRGYLLNDSTIIILRSISWCSVGCSDYNNSISLKVFNPPIIYKFVKCDTLGHGKNWIKHWNFSKKKDLSMFWE